MKPESPGMILGDAIDSVNAWAIVIGSVVIAGIGGACIGVYRKYRKSKNEADGDDIELRRKSDEADHANETYAIKTMRELYEDLKAEFRQAKKEHVALEKSVVRIQLESSEALSKCHRDHAIVSERLGATQERLRVSEQTAAELKAEVQSLESRLAAVEEGRT